MIGVSKERLYKAKNNTELDWDTLRAIDIVLRLLPPLELTPWLPIEDAPKGKDILLWCEFGQRIGYIDNHDKLIRAYGLGIVAPTYYQELPDDPEPGDKNARNT